MQVAGGLYFCYVSDRYQITQILKKNQTDVKSDIQNPKNQVSKILKAKAEKPRASQYPKKTKYPIIRKKDQEKTNVPKKDQVIRSRWPDKVVSF